MNISAFDDAVTKIDKSKTWISVKRKELISREIKARKYYNLASRYNSKDGDFSYYIIMLDEEIENRACYRTNIDDYGRVKIKLRPIWDKTSLKDITSDCNIIISHDENQSDGDIYSLFI